MADAPGGAQGIIVFTLWYIFIFYNYAMGYMPVELPPEPQKEKPPTPKPLPHEPLPDTR